MYIHVYDSIYLFTLVYCRYPDLFDDHIVPAVMYRYTQVLRRADRVKSKGKPLVTTARLEAVWKSLADRLATVVADTSMITLSTAYTAHFHYIYIDGKENAKMTGNRMKMLMLTLPFMVRDLIDPEIMVKKKKSRSFIQTAELAEKGTLCASWKRPGSNPGVPGPWAPERSALPTALLAPVISSGGKSV